MTDRYATFSEDGRHRYTLTRILGRGGTGHGLLFVMLNPSIADSAVDDPTVRRCVGFARSWGYDVLELVNLFAWIATDPKDLMRVSDPVGPDNDLTILAATRRADLVVCAWGAHRAARRRSMHVVGTLRESGTRLTCLGKTKSGAPRHPLYVPGSTLPSRFP